MKKILSILGTITIAGSGMTGILGNAPSPEKNNINYQQTNNLEKLKRNTRGVGATGIMQGLQSIRDVTKTSEYAPWVTERKAQRQREIDEYNQHLLVHPDHIHTGSRSKNTDKTKILNDYYHINH